MPVKKKVVKKRKLNLTPAERARRSAALKKNKLKARTIKVTLRRQYNFGGKSYGPGVMELPIHIARPLLRQEDEWNNHEKMLHGTKTSVVGPRGRTGHRATRMPDNMFKDPSWPNKIPEESFVGKGDQA